MFTGQLDDKFGIAQKLLLKSAAVSLLVLPLAVPSPALAAEQYWDGGDVSPDGVVDGGNGIWDASATNWTSVTGTANTAWGEDVGIFGGASGTVIVHGAQTFTELRFLTWGYYLNDDSVGGVLNAATGGATINVDTDVSATIYLPFIGGGITKTGAGTLSLLFDDIVDASGTVNTWVVEDGTLLINGGFKAGSWTNNKAVIVRNGANLEVAIDGIIDVTDTGGLAFQAVQLDGEGHVTVKDGGSVRGTISGTTANSTVELAGTNSNTGTFYDVVHLTGDDNAIDLLASGNVAIIGDRASGLAISGDRGVIDVAGSISSSGDAVSAVDLTGDDGKISIDGSISMSGSGRSSSNFSSAVSAYGDNNEIVVDGSVATTGLHVAAVETSGSNNRVEVGGSVTTAGDFFDPGGPNFLPHAVVMTGSGNELVVSGSVKSTGVGIPTVQLNGGSTFVLSGSVTAADASETAILFDDGGATLPTNTLELRPGYAITGLVVGDEDAFVNNLVFGGDSGSASFDVSAISDTGQFRNFGPLDGAFYKSGDSVWTLTGTNTTSFPGIFRLQGGTLLVDATFGGMGISNLGYGAATIGGSGTVAYIEIMDEGTVAPGGLGADAVGTLTTVGSFSMTSGSKLAFDLGAPGVVGGTTNDLIVVGGNLTLDGTLDIADAGGFGNGLYTLIQYNNLQADNGLEVGAKPDSELSYAIDAGTVGTGAGVVILTVSGGAAGNVQYWDGANATPGSVEGGTGTWNTTNTNWTDSTGTADDVWAEQFAIFGTTGGTVTVEGAQALTGMQFLTSGYTLTKGTNGELVTSLADTKIRVGSGITATIATPIIGSGGLSKQEAGTLILSGANTYSGTTAINGGILRTGAAGTLSAQSAHLVATGAQLDLDGYAQTIGSLSGSGSVLLGGATLTVGNDVAGSTFAGVVAGGGNLTKTGTQALILTGANTYTGLTTVEEGTLRLGNGGTSGSVAGNIQNDAELIFNRSDDVIFAGVLSGTGSTRFSGTGMTTLSADSSGFAGTASVSNGNLRIAAGGTLGTTLLTAEVDGTVSGLGTVVGGVSVLGTLAPGGSTLGTLTVDGNVAFSADSAFVVRIAADGSNDALAATTVELDGDVAVSAIDTHTSYLDGQTYTILATDNANGVSGTFDGATMLNSSAFLTPTLTYGADNVVLSIAVTADFTVVAETYNQTQVSGALNVLEQTGDALVVFNALAMLNPEAARSAFDLTSGEVHAAGQHLIDQTFALFSHTLRGRARSGPGGDADGFTEPLGYAPSVPRTPGVVAIDDATLAAPVAQMARAWITPLGGSGRVGGDGNASGIDWTLAGLAGGYEGSVDVATGRAWFGFGVGYLKGSSAIGGLLSTLDNNDFSMGAYGGWTDGPWSLSGSIAYMASSIESSRTISFVGVDRVAAAQYWAHSVGVSGEIAYSFDIAPDMTLSPLATLDAGWSGHGEFRETGAESLNLTGAAESWTKFDAGLGVALAYVMPTEVGLLNLEGRLVWEHGFGNATPSQSMTFEGSPTSFSVRGPDAGRDRLHVGTGLSFDATDEISFTARYDGRFSATQVNHAATFGLDVRF